MRREKRQQEESLPYEEEHVPEDIPDEGGFTDEPVSDALAALVAGLPPMERACVLLKDVLDYRLAEIAAVVESTLGGVKAALHRGRAKLRMLHDAHQRVELDQEQRKLLDAYVECFNRRDEMPCAA
jgi:RNA polymerase sigma-70 factor (ECF subfamily)